MEKGVSMDWTRHIGDLQPWSEHLVALALVLTAAAAGFVLYLLLFAGLRRFASRAGTDFRDILMPRWRGPARLLLPLLAVMIVTPSLQLSAELRDVLHHLLSLGFILGLFWLLANCAIALRDIILNRYDVNARDNLKARAVHTQVNVLLKITLVVIGVIGVASLLMTFEKIRQVGVSLLASAGVIGVIAGFAAQRSIATLIAGIQIAITQPIRLDDVVVVEGEWGRIEEITLTYVVVHIWDQRRLVLPVTYFLEKPFQNWTRVTSELLGTVFIYADYSVSVESLREELQRILKGSAHWDGRAWALQVTAATERTLELRALMSAADSPSTWELRCEVREKLLAYLQHHPHSLPRLRADIAASPTGP
jgi:small-conductance mechanosensitive channel